MIPSLLRRPAAIACFLFVAMLAQAEPAIVAKARAYLGPEAALEAIKSIHYRGSFVTPDPTDAKKMTYVSIEIVVQAPFQQRIVLTSDRSLETTGLDDYDGWHRVQDPKDSSRWRLTIVPKDQLKRLRANTWENLAFYRGIERIGGKVIDLGNVTTDGIPCQKLAYVHSDDVVFVRHFERSSGRLVLTETESGLAIREKGEIRVDGVRFPKSIVTVSKDAKGKEQTVTITFDQITVNESFPASAFTMPSVTGR
jgi:hypothetical protein